MGSQHTTLDLEGASVRNLVTEDRMLDRGGQAALVGSKHRLAPWRRQRHGSGAHEEVAGSHLTVVDQVDRHRFGKQRPELLGKVQSKRRPAETGPVVEPDVGIETNREQNHRQV